MSANIIQSLFCKICYKTEVLLLNCSWSPSMVPPVSEVDWVYQLPSGWPVWLLEMSNNHWCICAFRLLHGHVKLCFHSNNVSACPECLAKFLLFLVCRICAQIVLFSGASLWMFFERILSVKLDGFIASFSFSDTGCLYAAISLRDLLLMGFRAQTKGISCSINISVRILCSASEGEISETSWASVLCPRASSWHYQVVLFCPQKQSSTARPLPIFEKKIFTGRSSWPNVKFSSFNRARSVCCDRVSVLVDCLPDKKFISKLKQPRVYAWLASYWINSFGIIKLSKLRWLVTMDLHLFELNSN